MLKNITIIILLLGLCSSLYFNLSNKQSSTGRVKIKDSINLVNYVDTSYYRDTLPPIQDTQFIIKEYFKTTTYNPVIRENNIGVDISFDVTENEAFNLSYTLDYSAPKHTITLNRAFNKNYYFLQYSFTPDFNLKTIQYHFSGGLFYLGGDIVPTFGLGVRF